MGNLEKGRFYLKPPLWLVPNRSLCTSMTLHYCHITHTKITNILRETKKGYRVGGGGARPTTSLADVFSVTTQSIFHLSDSKIVYNPPTPEILLLKGFPVDFVTVTSIP